MRPVEINPNRRDFLYGLGASLGAVALTDLSQAQGYRPLGSQATDA